MRRGRRRISPTLAPALAIALALVLLAPAAAATVTVRDVVVPERTMAGKPFPLSITLVNDGGPRSVYVFAALYDKDAPGGPCGAAADPRFKRFTHQVQQAIPVPARATLVYPDADDAWLQLYTRDDVGPEPAVEELCVFVANASVGQQAIQYESFERVDLAVRGVNAIPTGSFAWDPQTPGATRDVRFRAEGSDADGDPVSFAWDFGYVGASGRARATGPSATTFFYPAGDYVVTLTLSDGLESATLTRTITVAEAGSEPPPANGGAGGREIPAPLLVTLVALALALRPRRAHR